MLVWFKLTAKEEEEEEDPSTTPGDAQSIKSEDLVCLILLMRCIPSSYSDVILLTPTVVARVFRDVVKK
jgi:hypothetical protein